MYKKLGFLLLVSFFVFSSSLDARTIGGVDMEETFKAGDTSLILNGAGIRQKLFSRYLCSRAVSERKKQRF